MTSPSQLEVMQSLDRTALHRQLIGDLAALITVRAYLDATDPTSIRRAKVIAEIEDLLRALWPTG